MTRKVTKENIEWGNVKGGLDKVINSGEKFKTKVSYAVIKNKIAIADALRAAEQMREKIIDENSGGKREIKPGDPGYETAVKDILELNREQTEVQISTIKLSDLPEDISVSMMDSLEFMIEES